MRSIKNSMINGKYEKKIFNQGIDRLGAIDEAGRGPLAGPVVAACVLMKNNFDWSNVELSLINDSKKISEKKREKVFEIVIKLFDYGVGIVDNNEIDRLNILQATFLAMKRAISNLRIKPLYILVDGSSFIPNISIKQDAIKKGDSKILSIAAASIIAKVSRDKIMKDYSKKYPEYFFEKHKGYGTKIHLESLKKYGITSIHRKSFAPVRDCL